MIYLILASICFSLSFGLIKNQLTGLPPDMVVELKLIFAGLLFLPFLKKLNLKKHLIASLIGIIQFGLMYVLFIRAFRYLQGSEVVLLTTSTPILVAVCSAFFGQRFKLSYLFCIVLSVLGAVIVIWDRVSLNFLLSGVFLMLLSNFCFAFGQVLWKQYVKEKDVKVMASAYLAAALFVLPFSIINTDFAVFSLTAGQSLSILYLGFVPTGIGFWLWNKGAKMVSPIALAVMNNLKIPLAVFFAISIFHEKINTTNFIIGSSFVLISIILSHILVKSK